MPPETPPINSDVYGSAVLEITAGQPLSRAMDPRGSTLMVMGCDRLDGSTGYTWDVQASPGHAMTFGPTRKGGKGVSSIIPALLTYGGSMLVIDPKGENAWITAERRRQMGQRVVILDPWNEVNRRYGSQVGITEFVTKYNPLGSLDPNSPEYADDIAAVADALVITNPHASQPHFDDSARQMVAGGNAAAVETHKPGEATLRDVRQLVTLDDEDLETELQSIRQANPDSLAARRLRRFAKLNPEIGSIRSTAETQTAFLDSETLLTAMSTDAPPFDLAELATGKVTLYLVLPVDRLESHGRWLRLIITLAIRAIARQAKPPALPVFFILDEMGTIGRLPMIESAFGLMAGLGIRLWGFLQDLPQLQRDYPGVWETFISNSSVIQVLKAHDATTSEYFSNYMGNGTVNAKTGGSSYKQTRWQPGEWEALLKQQADDIMQRGGPWDHPAHSAQPGLQLEALRRMRENWQRDPASHRQAAEQYAMEQMRGYGLTPFYKTSWIADEQLMSRPLMNSDEVRRLPDEYCLVLVPGANPLKLYRAIYYKHPLFKGTFRQNPNYPASNATNDNSVPIAAAAASGGDRGPRFDTVTGKRLW